MFGIFGLGPAEIIVLGLMCMVPVVAAVVVVVVVTTVTKRPALPPGDGLAPLERIKRELPALTPGEREELRRLLG